MPLLYKTESPRIGIWKMDESAEALRAMLPEATWEELLALDGNPRLSSDARQKEWMTSRLLVKELIGQTCGITHDTSGAPRLADSSLHISISHTRGYAAIILSDMQRTGIDIEYTSDRVRKIRSRFLSPEEESFIDPQTDTQQLLICWCAKETLYKIIGQEGIDFSTHLHIHPFRYSEPEGILHVHESKTKQQHAYTLHYQVRPEFILTYLNQQLK